jgi:uncharacterized protein YdcH (DUF465 family)
MEEREERMIASVLDKDPELRRYYKEHLEYEKLLAGLSDRGHLSPKEEMEKKRIQKLKLVGKDKIMQILGKYKTTS